jgi:hypothetical protein
MASEAAVNRLLTRIASNFRRGPGWASAVLEDWAKSLASYSDERVDDVGRLLLEQATKAPTLADVLAVARDTPVGGTIYPACDECQQTGWRQVAWKRWHVRLGGGDRRQSSTVYAAPCPSCARGRRFSGNKGVLPADVFAERLMRHPDTIEVIATNAGFVTLDMEDKLTPDEYERFMSGPSRPDRWTGTRLEQVKQGAVVKYQPRTEE